MWYPSECSGEVASEARDDKEDRMNVAPEATALINDYVDRVRNALPLAPSTRLAVADKLYHDILGACWAKAQAAGSSSIDTETVRAHLETLGAPEACANSLATAYATGSWQWPGDTVVDQFRSWYSSGRAEEFARAAAEKGEQVASATMDSVASALDIAARKLREAAEHLKTRQ
jgi:hypothetical protein